MIVLEHAQLEPGRAEEADRRLFDQIAHDYVQKDLTGSCRIARQYRLKQTLRSIGRPVGHLLEVGCGGGFAAEYLDGLYESYTGIDYSASLIQYANQFNAGLRRAFSCVNVSDFRADRRFDTVMMIGVLHHMPDPCGALAGLRGLLAPGAVVVANEPQRGNPVISTLRQIRKRVDSRYSPDQVEFSESELRSVFERAGYRVSTYPQGIVSTPFAETRPLPEPLSLALAHLATGVDPALEHMLGRRFAGLAWNVIAVGRSEPLA